MREYSCPEEAYAAYEAESRADEDQAHKEAEGCTTEGEAEELIDREVKNEEGCHK